MKYQHQNYPQISLFEKVRIKAQKASFRKSPTPVLFFIEQKFHVLVSKDVRSRRCVCRHWTLSDLHDPLSLIRPNTLDQRLQYPGTSENGDGRIQTLGRGGLVLCHVCSKGIHAEI